MSEVRQDLVLWQAYCEKKMALEDAQDEIEKLRAERDALKVERGSWITRYNIQVDYRIRAEAEFSHMQRRIARQRRALAKLYQQRHDRKAERDALKAENEKLRATLKDIAKHIWRGDWDKLDPETRALLGEKE